MQSELVRIAASQVGVKESGGNNQGDRVRVYQQATWLDPAPWPWCAAFVAWCLMQALRTPAGLTFLNGHATGSWRCKDASAFGWLKWANQKGLEVFDEGSPIAPRAGDLVVFDFSHIGIVEFDEPLASPTIRCIEGNTNGRGERDSESGDGVWRKTRAENLVRGYIRFPERLT